MVEPGLTTRLRQHSRRSGMMVGFSMLVTILILIAGFIWIYVRMGPLLSDFIPSQAAAGAASPVSQVSAAATPGNATPQAAGQAATQPTAVPQTPTPVWQATHRVAPGGASSGPNIYFRSGPSTASTPLTALPPGTELKFLGKTQPEGGVTWMQFERQDGLIGWIRNVDVVAIQA